MEKIKLRLDVSKVKKFFAVLKYKGRTLLKITLNFLFCVIIQKMTFTVHN